MCALAAGGKECKVKMKKLTVLIKPVSSLCNMHCCYCFYKDVAKNRKQINEKMSISTLTTLIDKTLSYCHHETIIEFCFQGGEPLLAGIDFFKTFIQIVRSKNINNQIEYSIQTNGILINEEWIQSVSYTHLDVYKRQGLFALSVLIYIPFIRISEKANMKAQNENYAE